MNVKCQFKDYCWCRFFYDEVTTVKGNYVKVRNVCVRCSEVFRKNNGQCPHLEALKELKG